jgi:5-hydroxyisourate hydrolase
MSHVTTHVLDAALGTPAVGIVVQLEHADGTLIGMGTTDADGRVTDLGPDALVAGHYRIVFNTAAYFLAAGQPTFYPRVAIDFDLADSASHYHVPLLLSPFAFSTYRGS